MPTTTSPLTTPRSGFVQPAFWQFLFSGRSCYFSREHLVAVLHGGSVKAQEQSEDSELIHRFRAGDPEAFGELVTKYRAKIYTMLYGMVRNENDAWDLAQEGFLQAWRSIHKFEGRSSFYTWLYSLTVNLAIDSLRRKGRRVEVELDDAIPCSVPSPRATYRRTEIRQHINAALAQLSPEHRVVIVLKEIEGLQCQEIAEILNLSIGTVMSRLFYGRKKLQSILRPIYNLNCESQRPRAVRTHLNKQDIVHIAEETPQYGHALDSSLNEE